MILRTLLLQIYAVICICLQGFGKIVSLLLAAVSINELLQTRSKSAVSHSIIDLCEHEQFSCSKSNREFLGFSLDILRNLRISKLYFTRVV